MNVLTTLLLLLLATAGSACAATVRYVWQGSPSPAPPYTSWATAAQTIQQAVDSAAAGDEIVVTNGTYATGGRAVISTMTNRVAVDKALTLRSVNGPQVTLIQGYRAPDDMGGWMGAGNGAVRCVYLSDGATLSGFTLTNGATQTYTGTGDISDQLFCGGGVWCAATNAAVSNCVLVGNSAFDRGGGAYQGTLNNCRLLHNRARYGGGAAAGYSVPCTLNNSLLTANTATWGGGVWASTLNNCTLVYNWATSEGGGVGSYSTANDCIIYHNTALARAANYGPYSVALEYCCTTPQPLSGIGNISIDPQLASATHLSASSPCRGAGSAAYVTGTDVDGEAWADPPSIGCDEFRTGEVTGPLSVAIAASYTNVTTSFPLQLSALIEGRTTGSLWEFGDGSSAENKPSTAKAWMVPGDYAVVLRVSNESHPAGVSATVAVQVVTAPVHYVAADSANPTPPYANWTTAARTIQDAVDAAAPNDEVVVTNGIYATGSRATDNDAMNRVVINKPLIVRSVNGPQVTEIHGYQVPGMTNYLTSIRCVYLASGANLSGFTLAGGATMHLGGYFACGAGAWCESQTAVITNCLIVGNVASVTDSRGGGVYQGTLYHCTIRSNSAASGGGAGYSTLNDCSLIGNQAASSGGEGGGAFCCTLNNCTLVGNRSEGVGGGASAYTLNNCTLTRNSAGSEGGGAIACTLNNCTLVGNSAGSGGGVSQSTLRNCIVYYNTAPQDPNYYWFTTFDYSCTTPKPASGVGNISSPPLLLNYAGGNLRLQSNSPCINTGTDYFAPGSTDLDGRPRIVGGTVDMGAYEFQGAGLNLFISWLQQYGLPTDGSADYADPDGDAHNNWQEWCCRTVPTNALSALRLLSASPTGSDVTVSWQSVAGVNYFLERGTNLVSPLLFTPLATGIPGQPSKTTFTDTNAAKAPRLFYRVGVGE